MQDKNLTSVCIKSTEFGLRWLNSPWYWLKKATRTAAHKDFQSANTKLQSQSQNLLSMDLFSNVLSVAEGLDCWVGAPIKTVRF